MLGGLDRPVQPRAEFAESLLTRLLAELADGRAPAGRTLRLGFRLPRILPGAPPRLRIALIVIALLLLLAGIATATYLGVREWVSAGQRGVQFTSDFELVELSRNAEYGRVAFAPDGDELYGIKVDSERLGNAALVRATGLREEQLETEEVLRFDELRGPALWDPGTDLTSTVVPEVFAEFPWVPAVAEGGDVALVATMTRAGTLAEYALAASDSTALLVRHGDGQVEKVLTFRELVDAGLLNGSALVDRGWIAVAFPEADRIVLHVQDRGDLLRYRSFYEVVDPNGDGDWSDREVSALELPEFLGFETPVTDPEAAWYPKRLAVEPSAGRDDREPSFLLTVQRFGLGEHRVYRVSDRNEDGDARDTGELELLFSGRPNSDYSQAMAPRLVVRDGQVVLRELILGGFTTRTRVSRVAETGEVVDIARAFFRVESVAADTDGNIYVLGVLPNADTTVLLKLKPVPAGALNAAGSQATTAGPVETTPAAATPTAPPELQRIAIGRYGIADAEFFLLGTNGRRLGTLFLPGDSGWLESQSPSGRSFVYRADTEIPKELFSYVGHTDGRKATKLAEKEVFVLCWLTEQSLATYDYADDNEGFNLSSRDLRTGRTKTLVRKTSPIGCSADGHSILLQRSLGGGEGPLELFDVRSGKRRRLTRPLPSNSAFGDPALSPDGRYVAYSIQHFLTPEDRTSGRVTSYDVNVLDLSTREPRLVHSAKTQLVGAAYPLWSPTSERLLLSISRPRAKPCTADELSRASGSECQRWDLAFVDAKNGTLEQVVSLLRDVPDVYWSPDGQSLAYTANNRIFVASPDGRTRSMPDTKGYRLFGWSPDGRYLGLVRQSPFWINGKSTPREVAVLELATGKVRTVVKTRAEWLEPRWWR